MSRRPLVLLALVLFMGVGGWLVTQVLWRGEPAAPRKAGEETSPPPPAPTGRSSIAGRVYAGTRPASATVDVYYRCHAEEADIMRASMGVRVDAVLRDARHIPAPVATVRTGTDGSFEVAGLAPGGYLLRATTSDGGFADRSVLVPLDGARVDGSLYLRRATGSLLVRVQAEDGTPWSGPVVAQQLREFLNLESAPPPWFVATPLPLMVPAGGQVVIPHLHPGTTNLFVLDLDAGRFVGKAVTIPHEGEFIVRLPPIPELVEGRLVHEGDPVPGARVLSSVREDNLLIMLMRRSDDEGQFLAFGGKKNAGFVVEADGFSDLHRARWDPTEKPELHLVRRSELRGKVISTVDDQPVSGAEVLATPVESQTPTGSPHRVRSAEDGSFHVVGVHAGEVMLFVLGGGFTSNGLKDVKSNGYNPHLFRLPEQAGSTFRLMVEPAATILGSVHDSTGRPVVGALVHAVPEPFRMWPWPQESTFTANTVTDADGRFELSSLMPDAAYEVKVIAVGHATHDAGKFVAVRDDPPDLDVELPQPRWLTVRVNDQETGDPVADASLEIRVEDLAQRLTSRELIGRWETGVDGAVLVGPLPPGQAWITAVAPEYLAQELREVGDEATSFDVSLGRGLAIVGRVEWADGDVAEGAFVYLETYVSGKDLLDNHRTIGADGAFRFAGLPEGQYDVVAYGAKDGMPSKVKAKAQAGEVELEFVLGRPAASPDDGTGVEVSVVGPDGKPVPAASGIYRDGAGDPYWIRVRNGIARLERATPGGVVEVWGADDAQGSHLPCGPASITLPEELADADLRILIPEERRIQGVVLDPEGMGIKGAMVRAHPPPKHVPSMPHLESTPEGASSRTDDEGVFVLRGLGDKTYTVTFSTPPAYLPVRNCEIQGGTTDVEVRLKAGGNATVTVLGPAASPVQGAEVRVMVSSTRVSTEHGCPLKTTGWEPMVTGTTNAEGIADLVGLDPERDQNLHIRPPKDRTDLKEHEITSWSPGDTTVRMEAGFLVRGKVVDAEGKPVVDARVCRKTGSSSWYAVNSGSDGSFVFWDLSPGDVHLRVEMEPHRRTMVEKTVPAGTTDVVLVVEDPGVTLSIQIENFPSGEQGTNATLRSEGMFIASAWRHISFDGRVTFHGLRPDWTYTLWVPPVGDGLSLMRTGIRGDSGEIRVTLEKGLTVTGRVLLPEGTTEVTIWATEFPIGTEMTAPGVVNPDGSYTIKGLTEGEWYVHARAEHRGRNIEETVRVMAGETADIKLR